MFTAELWLYPGSGAWVFVTLPDDIAHTIRDVAKTMPKRGFGSLKVIALVNGVEWKTSIFPDSASHSYLLPIKKEIRTKASISIGDMCDFSIKIVDV